MKIEKLTERIITICLILLLMASICLPACYATADEKQTVRVGYMDYNGFIMPQSDGTYSGYGAEYLAKISEYTGYNYEYVYGDWSDLLEMLKNREIDLLCTAQRTEERAQIFDFSAYPIGYTQGILYGRPDTDLSYHDYSAFDGLNFGIIRDSAMKMMFLNYEEYHHFTGKIAEFDSESEMTEALTNGTIDIMISEHLANHSGVMLLGKFGADAYYIMSYKNSPFLSDINFALQEIKTNVDFESELYHKYYDSSSAETALQFTTDEKAYIANAKTLTVGLFGSREPFAEYDAKTDAFTGICVDVMDEIAKNSGLKFKYVMQPPGLRTTDMLASGKYDIICGVERDNFVSNETYVATEAFLESAIVPVGLAKLELDLKEKLTVAYPASFQALEKHLETHYPNLKLVGYNLNAECLDAVKDGKADVFIQNTHLLSQLLQNPKYAGLAILPIEIMTEHTAMALTRSGNELLLSVLNKSIENLDSTSVNSSLIKHTFASPYEYTFGDMLYRFRIQISIIGVLLAICFALLIMVAVIKQRNQKKLAVMNAYLETAVTRADSASRAKSQFLAQMSHEIRTPMNAIIGLTGIAKTEVHDPAKMEDYLTKIDSSSKLLLGIINDVLNMSAIEGGKMKIDKEPFNFKQLLSHITTIFYQQAKMKNIDFQVHMNGVTDETLIGDELRVNQILMNLLSNAIKFTSSGGKVELMVLQASRSQDKVQLRFTVSDTGCGISRDMLDRLFRPFEQESATTARKHGGSGLGLSIAKNLVEMMGGTIGASSVVGKGTVFTVDIPFGTVTEHHMIGADGFSDIRTLVIDDDEESCEYSGVLLKRLGVRYEYVTSGEAALEMLGDAEDKGDPFKLCLVDWKLPDMDGVAVTQKIREVFGEETIVIIVSAYDLNEVEESGKAAGANYFIPKPLFQSTLFNALMRISNGDYMKIESEKEQSNFDFTGNRVLVVEDVALNMEVAIKLLQMVGVETTCAEDGRRAVEIFKKSTPGTFNCILMDINMPVMDGYEATKEIRRMDRPDAKDTPIYAMTANAFSEDVAAALDAGMNGHLAKPIETKVLYQTLQSIFEQPTQNEAESDSKNEQI